MTANHAAISTIMDLVSMNLCLSCIVFMVTPIQLQLACIFFEQLCGFNPTEINGTTWQLAKCECTAVPRGHLNIFFTTLVPAGLENIFNKYIRQEKLLNFGIGYDFLTFCGLEGNKLYENSQLMAKDSCVC